MTKRLAGLSCEILLKGLHTYNDVSFICLPLNISHSFRKCCRFGLDLLHRYPFNRTYYHESFKSTRIQPCFQNKVIEIHLMRIVEKR